MIHILATVSFEEVRKSSFPFYAIVVLPKASAFSIDGTRYVTDEKALVFLTPYQLLEWYDADALPLKILRFHGDFYCIEYHKKEVACNGVLFNNLYETPFVGLNAVDFKEVLRLMDRMEALLGVERNAAVLKSYLQVILALGSREKLAVLGMKGAGDSGLDSLSGFRDVLEQAFLEHREVSYYADAFAMSPAVFSRKIKNNYGKTPSKLIQERVVLEAKKQLHLSVKSIKEIAVALNFEDEFYFSRYFKKEVGCAPSTFRKEVGISMVVNSSRE